MADPGAPKDDIRVLTDRLATLEAKVRDLESPSGTQRFQSVDNIQATIATLQSQVTFLQTQMVSDAKSTAFTYGPVSNSGTNWVAFDGTYDASVSVTTGASGKLLIQSSANLIGASPVLTVLAIEIVSVTGPAVLSPFTAWVTDANASGARMTLASLAANTAYTVRLRRGVDGAGTALSSWQYQSLVVTRLG